MIQYLDEHVLNKHHEYCFENNGTHDLLRLCFEPSKPSQTVEPVDEVKMAYPICEEDNSWKMMTIV